MTRQEALEQFREETQPVLAQAEAAFGMELENQIEKLTKTIKEVFSGLRQEAVRLEKEKLMFFHISLLRTGILQQTWQAVAQALDARWYLDTEPAQVCFSLDFLFSMYGNVREELLSDIRKYMGKINSYDVEHLLEESVMRCNCILAQQTRYMFRDIEENEDFAAMDKTDVWSMYWGEYRDACELVACVNREPKSQTEFERALRQTDNEETSMIFSYWYGAELKEVNCGEKMLYFVQFENCTLENMVFDGAVLTGARFRNCRIQNCSFKGAGLRQADFENCVWEDNDFSEADLENAVFTEQELPFVHLDSEQLQVILVDRRRTE
ncbi:MAG: pentapeptide repeat-containing protein [Lachnospiraceae bacterium]|nr:pentapeptide repeat-containing protein [Lachnospiraceae bacterium]